MTSTIEGAREYAKLWAREKAKDPDYRAKAAARRKELRALDPARAETARVIARKHRATWSPEKKAEKAARHAEWHTRKMAEDPAYAEKKRADARETTKNRVKKEVWVRNAVIRKRWECEKRGIVFDMGEEDLHLPNVCPITLRPFVFGNGHQKDGPSIDRIFPAKGYVRGNVRIISRAANMARQDCLDPAIFERLALDARAILEQNKREPPLARKG